MAKIKGYWKWHEDESTGEWISGDFRWNCSFESNGQTFTDIETYYNTGVQCIGYIGEGTNKSVRSFSSQGDEIVATWNTKYLVMNFGATWQDIDDELYSFITNHADSWGMSDRLITIYDNEQKVYDKGYQVGEEAGDAAGYDRGYSAGEQDGYSAGELKGYNDGKTEGRAEGKAEGLKEGYDNGYQDGLVSSEAYEKGKQAEHDAFWGAFQTAQRTDWTYAFMGESWNDITFRPKYDLVLSGSSKQVFMNCKITDLEKILGECGVTLDTSGATALNQLFQGSTVTAIPTIDCTSCSIAGINYMFNKCTSLKTIRKLIVDSAINPATNPFTGCSALEYIRFEGDINWALKLGDSPKLTRESIENIIGHLYSGASNKTLTLSETAVNAAFGDEWDSYVTAHKPSGWNITLA